MDARSVQKQVRGAVQVQCSASAVREVRVAAAACQVLRGRQVPMSLAANCCYLLSVCSHPTLFPPFCPFCPSRAHSAPCLPHFAPPLWPLPLPLSFSLSRFLPLPLPLARRQMDAPWPTTARRRLHRHREAQKEGQKTPPLFTPSHVRLHQFRAKNKRARFMVQLEFIIEQKSPISTLAPPPFFFSCCFLPELDASGISTRGQSDATEPRPLAPIRAGPSPNWRRRSSTWAHWAASGPGPIARQRPALVSVRGVSSGRPKQRPQAPPAEPDLGAPRADSDCLQTRPNLRGRSLADSRTRPTFLPRPARMAGAAVCSAQTAVRCANCTQSAVCTAHSLQSKLQTVCARSSSIWLHLERRKHCARGPLFLFGSNNRPTRPALLLFCCCYFPRGRPSVAGRRQIGERKSVGKSGRAVKFVGKLINSPTSQRKRAPFLNSNNNNNNNCAQRPEESAAGQPSAFGPRF